MQWLIFCSLLLFCLRFTAAFNIDISDQGRTAKLIRPYPVRRKEGIQNPIYFGYNFYIKNETRNGPSFIFTGAPKRHFFSNRLPQRHEPRPLNTGNLFRCSIRLKSKRRASCRRITLPRNPNPTRGDSYGLSFVYSNIGNEMITCSPTKLQHCGVEEMTRNVPGYCFRSNSDGRSWRADKQTQNLRCPALARDILFLLDGSGSVGRRNFEIVKQWVIRLSRNFDLRNGTNRIGVVQYSHYNPSRRLSNQPTIRTEIRLGQYRNQNDFRNAVNAIQLQGFTTFTAASLLKILSDFQSSPRFRDPNTAKVLILLTDGNSTDRVNLSANAARVRSTGITTFAVGVGRAQEVELRTVATGDVNSRRRVYFVQDFQGLNAITEQLASEITRTTLEGVRQGVNAANQHNGLRTAQYGFSIRPSKRERPASRVCKQFQEDLIVHFVVCPFVFSCFYRYCLSSYCAQHTMFYRVAQLFGYVDCLVSFLVFVNALFACFFVLFFSRLNKKLQESVNQTKRNALKIKNLY